MVAGKKEMGCSGGGSGGKRRGKKKELGAGRITGNKNQGRKKRNKKIKVWETRHSQEKRR